MTLQVHIRRFAWFRSVKEFCALHTTQRPLTFVPGFKSAEEVRHREADGGGIALAEKSWAQVEALGCSDPIVCMCRGVRPLENPLNSLASP